MLPTPSEKLKLPEFRKPVSFHRPVYMWCWNSPVTAEGLIEQLRELEGIGAGGVMVVPEPPEFRPEVMKTTLSPEYLGEDYLAIYAAVTAEAARLGLNLWFYDEGGWPSGSACGKVTKAHPEFACKRLFSRRSPVKQGDTVPGGALGYYLYTADGVTKLDAGTPCPADGELLTVDTDSPKGSSHPLYPDLLNPDAVDAFLELGCEPYLPHIGPYIESAVPFLFTDEPCVCNPPWNEDLVRAFEEEKGYAITDHLNALFEQDEKSAKVRIDYIDVWSKRFAATFFARMRRWCHENSMAFGGHLGGDDTLECLRRHGYGNPLRMYREMDVPGVDAIIRQIFPGGRRGQELILDQRGTEYAPNYHYPRWATSVARQHNKPWVFSESFAVYGQGLTPTQMKWIVNYQLARGVNLFCFATLASSVSGPYMANERPVQTKQSPLWACLKPLHDYTARMSYLCSLGKPVCDTAVYMPVRDVWGGAPSSQRVMREYDIIARELESLKVDFDVLDDDALAAGTVTRAGLTVGAMTYKTIFVPYCRHMTDAAWQRLQEFKAAGGKLLIETKRFAGGTLMEPLRARASLTVRETAGGRLYIVFNEDEKEQTLTLTLPEKKPPVLLDAETGNVCALEYEPTENGVKTTIKLPFAGSAVVYCGGLRTEALPPATKKQEYRYQIPLEEGWQFRKSRAFVIGEQELESVFLNNRSKPAELGTWEPYAGAEFSGKGQYSITFDIPTDITGKKVLLSLGKVEFAARVRLNGKDLGLRPWPPFEFDVTDYIRPAGNVLTVKVINTPANQYVHTQALDKFSDAERGCYHEKALVFEKDSLGGGLYGKVVLYVE